METGFTFAEAGAAGVLFADVSADAAAKAADESKKFATNQAYKALSTEVDVTNVESVQKMVDLAMKEFGRIDYCINAAGVRRDFSFSHNA